MNSEMLETLLFDRAFGELTPEVAALLEDHVERTPDAARRAAEIHATMQLASASVTSPGSPSIRALDVDCLRAAETRMKWSTRRMQILPLAACLALGLGVGWLAHSFQPPAETPANHPAPALALATSQPAASPARFWSLARLEREQTAITPRGRSDRHPVDLNWKSAAKLPHLEEYP